MKAYVQKLIDYLKPRIRNYGFWVSLFALIPMVLNIFGIQLLADYNNIVQLILSIFVILGIVNNPTTTNSGYGDDPVIKTLEELLEEIAKFNAKKNN